MDTSLHYQSTAADDRHVNELRVEPDGRARLTLGTNRDQRSRGIGHFEAALPAELLQRLQAALAAPAFAALESQPSLVPDEAYRSIELRRAGAVVGDKVYGEQMAAPPAFAAAEALIVEAMALVAKSPRDALSLRLSPPVSTVHAGAAMHVEMLLGNLGPRALLLPAPRRWGQVDTAAGVQLLRDDVALERLGPADQRFIALGAAALVAADPPASGAWLRIDPERRVRLRFSVPMDLPPGRWRLVLNLEASVFDEREQPLFGGGLFTEPVLVEVRRRT